MQFQVKVMGILRQFNNEIIVGHNVGPHEYNASTYAIKVSTCRSQSSLS